MLEGHVIKFIKKWKLPLGFFGEQGGESIHHELALIDKDYSGVKPDTRRLKGILETHYLRVDPENQAEIPQVKPRNLKRKAVGD